MKKNKIRLALLGVVAAALLTIAAIRAFADIPSQAICPLDGEVASRSNEPCTVSGQTGAIVCIYEHQTGYGTYHRFYLRVQ